MTATRFAILSLLAICLAGLGALLWFEPVPAASAPQFVFEADALLASSASAGVGLLLPQLAVAAPNLVSGPANPPGVVAIAAKKTPTPRATRTDATPSSPTATALAPTQTRQLTTATPAITNTPAPTPTQTRTAGPSPAPPSTPLAPTRTPQLTTAITLSRCGDITSPGLFTLGGNLSNSGDCLNIRSSNVTLDCKGLAITGADFQGYGIAVRNVGLLPQRPQNIEIRNCNLSGFRYGLWVDGSVNLYVHDNDASRNFSDVDNRRYGNFLGMAEGGGIRLNNSQSARVENNTTNSEAIGIDVRGSTGVKVRGNTASDNTAWGINLLASSGNEVSSNATASNVRYCTWGAGEVGPGCDAGGIIMQNGASNNLIANNKVTGNNGNGIFIKAHGVPCGNNNVISGNTITGAIYNAIELGFCSGNQIVNNNINGGLDGIWMGFAVNSTIKGNTIQNMNNHGIISNNSRDNTIANNQLLNDREAIYLYWEQVNQSDFWWLDVNQYPSKNNTISGNTLNDNTVAGIHLKNSTDNQITNNTLNNNRRNFWLDGNSRGNNITGNNPNGWLMPLNFLLARALR